ncbi:MAG: F0F1 ATP synthase subunit C [Pseudomonadota bacterium]
MDAEAAKYIGAGLATLPLAGVGVGLGIIFGNFMSGALRNPSAAPSQQGSLFLTFALTEATGLFGLLISFLILFG